MCRSLTSGGCFWISADLSQLCIFFKHSKHLYEYRILHYYHNEESLFQLFLYIAFPSGFYLTFFKDRQYARRRTQDHAKYFFYKNGSCRLCS